MAFHVIRSSLRITGTLSEAETNAPPPTPLPAEQSPPPLSLYKRVYVAFTLSPVATILLKIFTVVLVLGLIALFLKHVVLVGVIVTSLALLAITLSGREIRQTYENPLKIAHLALEKAEEALLTHDAERMTEADTLLTLANELRENLDFVKRPAPLAFVQARQALQGTQIGLQTAALTAAKEAIKASMRGDL